MKCLTPGVCLLGMLLFVTGVMPSSVFGQIALPTGGEIATVVGTGTPGYSGDGNTAISAQLAAPSQVATDPIGNLYIADQGNQRIRKVDRSTGLITTLAGNGKQAFNGDGESPQNASFDTPSSVAADGIGHVYVADQGNNRIRMVDTTKGTISTIVGTGKAAYTGDGGPATSASLNAPTSVALDANGDLYIVDSKNQRIRKVDHKTGIISTVAGNGYAGYFGDNGPATAAELNGVTSIVVDHNGHLDIADAENQRIRQVDLSTGIITTIAGNGLAGYYGDGGLSTEAKIDHPTGVAVDPLGDLYIADHGNYRIRIIDPHTGIITTYAGNGSQGIPGEEMEAMSTSLDFQGLAVDQEMNVFFAHPETGTIRAVGSHYAVKMVTGSDLYPSAADSINIASLAATPEDYVGEKCNVYNPTGPSNLPASAASYVMTYQFSWDSLYYCVQSSYGSNASWLTLSIMDVTEQNCSLSDFDSWETCVLPFQVTQNTGASRSGAITITFIDNSWERFVPTQQGTPENFTVSISGSGAVTSSPSGISCPGTCSVSFQYGTSLTLSAQAATGYQFTGWSGACSGTGRCTLTMNSAEAVSATFTPIQEPLTVTVVGSGTVMSSPVGISCPGVCTTSFSYGTTVYLTATAATGYMFVGWSGACSGTGTCAIQISGSENVTATFSLPTFSIMVGTPTHLPVKQGSSPTVLSIGHVMTYPVTVTPLYGFTGTVTLSASGLPSGVTASFSSATLSSGTSTMTLTSSYNNPETKIGSFTIVVTGTGSGATVNSAGIPLTTQVLAYKGDCSVTAVR
ncbi:MAG: hypothetical protein WCA21_17360 [Terracidiphilus sp.]